MLMRCADRVITAGSGSGRISFAVRRATTQPPKPTVDRSRTWLGTSLGVSLGTLTFSIVAWPIAEVIGGTYVVGEALRRGQDAPTNAQVASTTDVVRLRTLMADGAHSAKPYVVAGGSQHQRSALARAVQEGRPTMRISFREAVSPHSMNLALIQHCCSVRPI